MLRKTGSRSRPCARFWRRGRKRDGGGDHGLDLLAATTVSSSPAPGSITRWRKTGCSSERLPEPTANKYPAAALIAQGLWAAFLTLPRTVNVESNGAIRYGNVYTQLLEYIVAADLVFYVLLVASVIVLRRKNPELPRPYRAWGYPVVPAISIALRDRVNPGSGSAGPGHLRNRLCDRAQWSAGFPHLAPA